MFLKPIDSGGTRVSWVHRNPQTKNFVFIGGKGETTRDPFPTVLFDQCCRVQQPIQF